MKIKNEDPWDKYLASIDSDLNAYLVKIRKLIEKNLDFEALLKAIHAPELDSNKYKFCRTFIVRLRQNMMSFEEALQQRDLLIIDERLAHNEHVTDEHFQYVLNTNDLELFFKASTALSRNLYSRSTGASFSLDD